MDEIEMTVTIGENIYYEENKHAVEGRVIAFDRELGMIRVMPLEGLIKFKKWISCQDVLSEDEISWD